MTQEMTNKWVITVTVMLGTIMSALDTSIVNVAMPYMRGNMGATVEEIAWVATGYILSTVLIMPIIGMLSSRYGRKRFYLGSIVLFTISSLLCGMAWDLTSMIIFRVIQGIGGGALIPVSQAILRESFPPEEQGVAMGVYGFGVVLGPAFGPLLGGWLTDNFSWPWIFYINIPVGIINILLVMRYIHDPAYLVREKGRIDFPGLALMIIGLGALQLLLEKGQSNSWFESPLIRYLAFISAAGIILFVWRELTTERPAVNLRILRDINFSTGSFIGGIMGMGLYGSIFLLPLFLQQLLGYPAFESGLTLMPRSLAMALAMPLAGRFYNRLGPRFLIGGGLIITSFSFYQLSRLSLDIGYWDVFLPQFLQGAGFGMIFVALSTSALSSIERRQMTDAAGLYNVIRQVFGSIGIALAATELTKGIDSGRAALVEKITLFSDTTAAWHGAASAGLAGRGLDPALAPEGALRLLDGAIMRQAAMLSYNSIFLLVTCVFVLTLPLVLFIKKTGGGKTNEMISE